MPRPNLCRDFLLVYTLLAAARTLPRLISGGKLKKVEAIRLLKDLLLRRGKGSRAFKEAVFAVALPRAYSFWNRHYPDSVLPPALLSSPLLQLVDPALRRTLAVYVATAAAVNYERGSRHRQLLPPAWTLILIANTWLLWAFLFQPECFPRGYGDIILRHSGYGSSGEPSEQILQFLRETQFEVHPPGVLSSPESAVPTNIKIHPRHTRAVCARLHPQTPSCLLTYVRAWVTQFPQVFRWVGAFGALALLFSRRIRRERPRDVFMGWLISSLRGTAFVIGAINTSWGLTCLFQRILPPGCLPHLRWIGNGLLGSLWVLALPAKRRTDFALYSTRLAVGSCWDLFNNWSPSYGEALVLALSWSSLLRDRRNGKGPRGLAALALDYIDAHAIKAS